VIRILIRTAIYLGSAALGLWIASLLLDGFEIQAPGFLVATIIFAGTQFLLSPHVTKASERYAVALTGGVGLISTLVALVKQAGLVKTLNSKGPFTVFAPTNTAFVALKKAAPDTYDAVTTDKALLTKVLTYHVLAKRVPSAAAVPAANKQASVKTVQGETIKLSLQNGKLTLNGSSRVIVADVKASNGVVHAINAVLVPTSLS